MDKDKKLVKLLKFLDEMEKKCLQNIYWFKE